MYLSGLRLGFSHEELRRMPFWYLSNFIVAWSGSSEGEVREATQADIDAILG